MADKHNFYRMMLGLPEDATSPNAYELLGLELFEVDEFVIRESAIDANQKLLAWQNSQYHAECDHLMDMVVEARIMLLDAQEKATYDEKLRERLGIDEPVAEVSLTAGDTAPNFDKLLLVGLVAASVLVAAALVFWRDSGEKRAPVEPEASNEAPNATSGEVEMSSEAPNAMSSGTSSPPLLQSPFGETEITANRILWAKYWDVKSEITNAAEMSLVLIPPGEFMMGSSEFGTSPQHRVQITKPFFLQTTEVTQGQWKTVMGTKPWVNVKGSQAIPDT
jgi:formylglycine-generating enzyme required for sulfatase activity